MTSPKKVKTTAQVDEQSKLFIETARNLGCDESVEVDDVMRHLAAQKKRPSSKTGASKAKKKAAK